MSGSVNKIILLGNLGSDPELRHTKAGNAVTTLSIATHRDIKKDDGSYEASTEWHKAVVWGKRAETCATHLKRGSGVYLEGPVQLRSWKDKEGKEHLSQEILVQDIKFVGRKPETATVLEAVEQI